VYSGKGKINRTIVPYLKITQEREDYREERLEEKKGGMKKKIQERN